METNILWRAFWEAANKGRAEEAMIIWHGWVYLRLSAKGGVLW